MNVVVDCRTSAVTWSPSTDEDRAVLVAIQREARRRAAADRDHATRTVAATADLARRAAAGEPADAALVLQLLGLDQIGIAT